MKNYKKKKTISLLQMGGTILFFGSSWFGLIVTSDAIELYKFLLGIFLLIIGSVLAVVIVYFEEGNNKKKYLFISSSEQYFF